MKFFKFVLAAYASLCVVGCSQQAMVDKFTPHPESEYAQQVLSDIRTSHYAEVQAKLIAKLQTPATEQQLRALTGYFPKGEPRSIKTVGAQTLISSWNGSKSESKYVLTYEYEYPKAWVLAGVTLVKNDDRLEITGIEVRPMTQSLEQAHAFTFAGKGVRHMIFALLAAVIPLFCLYAFVVCLCTPIKRRKWLWALVTLLGVITVKLNWTTGAMDFQLVSVQLFGASAFAPAFGPWIVGISFPLGAVWFLWRRRQLRADPLAVADSNKSAT